MVEIVKAPEGFEGPGFFATKLDYLVGLARKNSLWPLPFATSCCGIEFMATMGSNYDMARFGMERMSFSPRQADLLIVAGTISKKLGPILIISIIFSSVAAPKSLVQVSPAFVETYTPIVEVQ